MCRRGRSWRGTRRGDPRAVARYGRQSPSAVSAADGRLSAAEPERLDDAQPLTAGVHDVELAVEGGPQVRVVEAHREPAGRLDGPPAVRSTSAAGYRQPGAGVAAQLVDQRDRGHHAGAGAAVLHGADRVALVVDDLQPIVAECRRRARSPARPTRPARRAGSRGGRRRRTSAGAADCPRARGTPAGSQVGPGERHLRAALRSDRHPAATRSHCPASRAGISRSNRTCTASIPSTPNLSSTTRATSGW